MHEWLKKTKIITKAYCIVNSTYTVSYTDRCTSCIINIDTGQLEGGGGIYQRIDIEHCNITIKKICPKSTYSYPQARRKPLRKSLRNSEAWRNQSVLWQATYAIYFLFQGWYTLFKLKVNISLLKASCIFSRKINYRNCKENSFFS